jgi:hypothetical protein
MQVSKSSNNAEEKKGLVTCHNNERTCFGCKSGTASNALACLLLELKLEPYPKVAREHERRERSKNHDQLKLPTNYQGQNRTRDNVDDVDEYQYEVEPHQFLHVGGIVRKLGGQCSTCVCLVEESHILFEYKVEDLASVAFGHILRNDAGHVACCSEDDQVADSDHEEHECVEIALRYLLVPRKLEGLYDTAE